MNRHHISAEEFVGMLESGKLSQALIIDVREQEEWDYYHLESSVHLPMNTIPEIMDNLPTDKNIYVLCAHGVRSEMVTRYFMHNGLDNVINVEGGIAAIAGLRGFHYD